MDSTSRKAESFNRRVEAFCFKLKRQCALMPVPDAIDGIKHAHFAARLHILRGFFGLQFELLALQHAAM